MVTIRAAERTDLDAMTALLVEDAVRRAEADQTLWALHPDARIKVRANVETAVTSDAPAFRQRWLVADRGGALSGLAHTLHLPVPPIYAGAFGPPGLIMEDCAVAREAPAGTAEALIAAAEDDLVEAGAVILLASSVPEGPFEAALRARDYEPLTLYFARSGLHRSTPAPDIRRATDADLAGIATQSAVSREVLHALDPFWKPHDEAAPRFAAWMEKSLTLPDRDMLVSGPPGSVTGYAISQPVTPLHLPPAHDIAGVGIIDDFHHEDMRTPDHLGGNGAAALFAAAEGCLAARGARAALVVCPAAWASKAEVLHEAGYRPALTWHIKRAPRAR